MPTYRLLLEYEGTRFSGWQSQTNTPKTIQGNLIQAAKQLFGEADVGGAGRTDAGVHAAGQVAHLRISAKATEIEITRKLNDALPHDVHVLAATLVDDRFHARHDAQSRVYLYQISTRRTAFAKPFVWWIKDKLNFPAMESASKLIVGRHDFTNFSDRRGKEESKIVVVESLELGRSGSLILIRVTASHYLWKMVRKLVSALVEIGRGNLSIVDFQKILEGNSALFEMTAPPSGLFLEAVTYPGETFDRPLQPLIPVESPYFPPRKKGTKRG